MSYAACLCLPPPPCTFPSLFSFPFTEQTSKRPAWYTSPIIRATRFFLSIPSHMRNILRLEKCADPLFTPARRYHARTHAPNPHAHARTTKATMNEHDGDTPLKNWGRAGMSPMSTPTRPGSAEPSVFSNPVPLQRAARTDSRESTGSSKEDAVFAPSTSSPSSPITPPSEFGEAGGNAAGLAGTAGATGAAAAAATAAANARSGALNGCYNSNCSKRSGIPSAYKCYSPNCRQSKFKFAIDEGVFNVTSRLHTDQQHERLSQSLFQYVHVDVYLREVKMLQALVMDGSVCLTALSHPFYREICSRTLMGCPPPSLNNSIRRGRSNPPATSRCSDLLLLSLSADTHSPDDGIAF